MDFDGNERSLRIVSMKDMTAEYLNQVRCGVVYGRKLVVQGPMRRNHVLAMDALLEETAMELAKRLPKIAVQNEGDEGVVGDPNTA